MDPEVSISPPTEPQPVVQQPQSQTQESGPTTWYKVVGILNIVIALFPLIFGGSLLLYVVPQLASLYETLEIQSSIIVSYIAPVVMVCLAGLNLFLGVKLLRNSTLNKSKYLKFGLGAIFLTFFITCFLIAVTVATIVLPIYKLSEDVSDSPTVSPSPVSDSTINWKTHANSQYGYSIKYPENWFVYIQNRDEPAANELSSVFFTDEEGAPAFAQGTKLTLRLVTDNIERSKRFLSYGDAGLQNKAEITSITVDGKEAIAAVVTLLQYDEKLNSYVEDSKSYQILIPHGNNSIWIVSDLEDKPIVDQILSTFKFTDVAIDTSDWKAYKNTLELSEYGFSLRYPSEWSYKDNLKLDKTLQFGPLSTQNHIGEKVEPYVSPIIVLTISSFYPGTSIETVKNIAPNLKPVWKDVLMGNLSTKQVAHLGCLSGDCMNIIFTKNNVMYDFSITQASDEATRRILNKVVSNFKFTE